MRELRIGRRFVLAAGSLLACRKLFAADSPSGDRSSAAVAAIGEIERELGGRVGVAALDTGNGAQILHRADERFAMCSTFKWVLGASVLARVDQGKLTLNEMVKYSAKDLIGWSPVTTEHLKEGALSIGALCDAAIEQSDNGAANLLLAKTGGPPALTAFLRGIGDATTRLDRNEPELNMIIDGDPRDTTTPAAMVQTMRKILLGEVLKAPSRTQLIEQLKECKTGLSRLRAGFPLEWIAGDKTGTGEHGASNDVAIAWPPARQPILIAAYLCGSSLKGEALNAGHARIARIIAGALA